MIPDLFLPREALAVGGVPRVPALEKLLARALSAPLPLISLEAWLCATFGTEGGAVAPITLQADGASPGDAYWLRADPVHLVLRGNELIMHPIASLAVEESTQLCDSLNLHFAGDGLHFVTPRPQRWYLRLEHAPRLTTHTLAQAAGKDVREYLPQGPDALHWHRLLNEIQMLLFAHPVNQAREARGELAINSVWLWGGGRLPERLLRPFGYVRTDSPLAVAFAQAAGIAVAPLSLDGGRWASGAMQDELVVWHGLTHALQEGGVGGWHDSLQELEHNCVNPLLRALQRGRIDGIALDALQEQGSVRFTLTRGRAWQLWRGGKSLKDYAGDRGQRQ